MAWQDVARQLYGGNAEGVIQGLSAYDPNFDWSSALQSNYNYASANSPGFDDPGRASPYGTVQTILQNYAPSQDNLPTLRTAQDAAVAQSSADAARIQREQASHGGGGFLGLGDFGNVLALGGLALGGAGLAGYGPLSGLLGGVGAGTAAATGGGMSSADLIANGFDPVTMGEVAGNFTGGSADFFNGLEGSLGGTGVDVGGGVDMYGNPLQGNFQGGIGTPGGSDFYSPGSLSDMLSQLPQQALSQVKSYLQSGGTAAGLMSLIGKLAPSLLGAYASNKQTDAYNSLAQQYAGYGAPYRAKLQDVMNNPSGYLSSPEVTVPVQQGSDIMARSLSTQGNPATSGNALQQLQSYATGQLYGKLQDKENQLAGFGGLTQYNSAAPQAATNAIGSQANTYNAIGAGVSDIFNPQPTLAQTLAQYKQLSQAL